VSEKKRKALLHEELTDLAGKTTSERTKLHWKRIFVVSSALPLAACISACGSGPVVERIPPPPAFPRTFVELRVDSALIASIDGGVQGLLPNSSLTLPGARRRIDLSEPENRNTLSIEITVAQLPSRTPNTDTPPSGILKPLSTVDIRVDGKPTKRFTPDDGLELGAGTHRIEFFPVPPGPNQSFTLEFAEVPATGR